MTEKHIINMDDKYATREHYDKCIADSKEVTSNVRVLCVDRISRYPVAVMIDNNNIFVLTKEGRGNTSIDTPTKHDLIKIPTKKEGWCARYPDNSMSQVFYNKITCERLSGLPDPKIVKVWWYE